MNPQDRTVVFARTSVLELGQRTLAPRRAGLAGALLISEEAALTITRSKLSLSAAAKSYGGIDMVRGRINVTAARRRARPQCRQSKFKRLSI